MIDTAPSVRKSSALWAVASDYLALTKPPIIVLLVVTALGAMFLAAQGAPPLVTSLYVVIGGSLAAGGANALNQYLERDIDGLMTRTTLRPIPGHRIEPRQALVFGLLLNVMAFALLSSQVNLLSALLTLSATLFYTLVYTQWLKRSTTQNIVIGGAAGAIPPMVGWAAVTGSLGLPALYLFGIVFFWTPPHFWALAILIRHDYARARVPMLPVVRGIRETASAIMLHSILLVTITLLFFTVDGLGWSYFAGASALGIAFLAYAGRLLRAPTVKHARALYLYSLAYLALLFLVIATDGAV